MAKTSATLTVRMPKTELDSLIERAKGAGMAPSTFARARLNREHVDTAAATALLHELMRLHIAEMDAWRERIDSRLESIGADAAEAKAQSVTTKNNMRVLAEAMQKLDAAMPRK